MDATTILNDLTIQGFQLSAEGDQLIVKGPNLTADQREQIRQWKPLIVSLLKPEASSYEAQERLAIQTEHLATEADAEWPSFEGVKQGILPQGWEIVSIETPLAKHANMNREASGRSPKKPR